MTDEELLQMSDEKERAYRDFYRPRLSPLPGLVAWLDRCGERPSVAAEMETVASLAA